MTTAGTVRWHRYDWGVADVQRFDHRVDEVLTRMLGRPVQADEGWAAQDEATRRAYWAKHADDARQEWLAAKVEVLLRSLPHMYRNAEPRHDLSLRWLAAYDREECVNLGIFGPARVGKTWEAAGITRQLLLKRVPALMVRVPEMLKKLRPNADGATELVQFQAAPVLVMDDLGVENVSAWVEETLYLLTDYRSRNLLPTIVTSNFPVETKRREDGTRSPCLADSYSDRLLGRLFENAAELVIRERPADIGPKRFGAQL